MKNVIHNTNNSIKAQSTIDLNWQIHVPSSTKILFGFNTAQLNLKGALNNHVLSKIFYKCLLEAVKDGVVARQRKYQLEISELLFSLSDKDIEFFRELI